MKTRPRPQPLLRVFLFFAVATFLYVFLPPFFRSRAPVTVPVYSHSSAREIAADLQAHGVLTARWPFRLLCKVTRVDRRLKAGLYRLSPRMSLWSVMRTLASGKSDLMTLRVPEGFTASQIGQELENLGLMTQAAFISAVQDRTLVSSLGIGGSHLEGFLYPETYRVPLGADAKDLARLMVEQFRQVVGNGFAEAAKKQGLTPYKAVVLASIVEKEARIDGERPVVAGVLYNRLRKKMRLEVNATLNYVLENRRSWLTYKQLDIQTPYNTYRRRGLPPTPICNPGKASLQSVLAPASTDYLYYVSQGDGTHLFASTFEQHQANVRKAKRLRRQQKMRVQ